MGDYKIGDKVKVKKEYIDVIVLSYDNWESSLRLQVENGEEFMVCRVNDVCEYNLSIQSLTNNEMKINVKNSEVDAATPQKQAQISGTYEQKGKELGALVDTKQEAYGNAIIQTYEVVKAFMVPYYNEEDKTYTIPQSLLQHLLLQVRIIDKQNRIFNNPDFDLMGESPYSDICGYGLLGANMVIDK